MNSTLKYRENFYETDYTNVIAISSNRLAHYTEIYPKHLSFQKIPFMKNYLNNLRFMRQYLAKHRDRFCVIDDIPVAPKGVSAREFYDNELIPCIFFSNMKKVPLVVTNKFVTPRLRDLMQRINRERHVSQRIDIPIFYMFS